MSSNMWLDAEAPKTSETSISVMWLTFLAFRQGEVNCDLRVDFNRFSFKTYAGSACFTLDRPARAPANPSRREHPPRPIFADYG